MLQIKNSCSILYILFTWLILVCSSFVILSSASGENNVNLFQPGQILHYQLQSTVLLNEKYGTKNVGFYISGEVLVQTVWGNDRGEKILKIQIKSPQLHIRSRKSPAPDGFIPHSSHLDKIQHDDFWVVWKNGIVDKVILPKDEETSIANLKKGIASLLQFQLLDTEINETDSSGNCLATYRSLSASTIIKSKTNCISSDFSYINNSDLVLGTIVESSRTTKYVLDESNNFLKSIKSKETHQMYVAAKEELGNFVAAEQTLTYAKTGQGAIIIEGNTVEDSLAKVANGRVTQESLLTERDLSGEEVETFVKALDNLRDNLSADLLGNLKPARAFLRLVSIARHAKKDDITKALSSKKNKNILHQIYDVLGYAQTKNSHQAVLKKLQLDKEEHVDLYERYLWALSFSSQPNMEIIEDLLKKYKNHKNVPEKLRETLILTIASMTHRLGKITKDNVPAMKLSQTVEETILNELDYAKNEERYVFFRALKNLQSKTTIPKLLEVIKNGSSRDAVLAWKALKSFPPNLWDSTVTKTAEKSFFQLDKKYDSSSRTLAADILLESHPSEKLLGHMLRFLVVNDTAFEVKQYAYQRIKMIADENEQFKNIILMLIRNDKTLNNYSALSPRGLSLALKRNFLKSNATVGSLVSIQEMKSGIAKRGIVNIIMEKNGKENELFSLGIFSGGLSSFVSSNSEDDAEEESATAGMELTVLNTQIRPFVFFNGQGELMGHVWSGTASEKTPAFQALVMLQDHLEYLRLGSGYIVEVDLKGVMSFDLSGQIEISIWNRNAKSLVEKSAGILTVGTMKVDTNFVKSKVEFSASLEPKLNLQTDVDFSSNTHLCMRLTQPDSLFRHNIFKIERIPGSKHKLRIAKYKKYTIPGTTYSLNKKNNEMCSAIFI